MLYSIIYICILHIHTWYEQWFAHPKLKFNCHWLKWMARTARWLEHRGVARIPWCVESSWCARDGSEKGWFKLWPSMVIIGFSLNNPCMVYLPVYLPKVPKCAKKHAGVITPSTFQVVYWFTSLFVRCCSFVLKVIFKMFGDQTYPKLQVVPFLSRWKK